MNDGEKPHRITRRRFLVSLGAVVTWVATGCGRRRTQEPTSTLPSPLAPAAKPSVTPTALPTVTPTVGPTTTPLPAGELADMILLNGKVITVNPTDAIVQAVTIKNGLIQAVGSTEELQSRVGPATQVVDLKGKAVTPGLIDAHNHFQLMGLMGSFYVAFLPPDVRSVKDLQAKLAQVVAQTPKGEWIQGYYLALQEGRPADRYELDSVSPDHPVWIMHQGGHFGSSNSMALRIAGITASTPNPQGGVIERDNSGEPTGVFYNHRAMDMLRRSAPQSSTDEVRKSIASTVPLFTACGITSFHDNNVRDLDVIDTYMEAGRSDEMTLRGAVFYTLEWPKDLTTALQQVGRRDEALMRFAGFKFLIDGQATTAYCHQAHSGTSWNMPTWDPAGFKQAVRALHDTGLQISVHCAGDAAADLVLDAYEEAMNANPRPDPRHRIEHAILTTPQATQRMQDLGVVVCAQPHFLRLSGNYWTSVFGAERIPRTVVTREWLDNGVHLALGSDAPTVPWYAPQVTLAASVSRLSGTNEPYGPEQKISIQEALRAHTMGSAYALHEEKIKGSIEVGKLADLVVWGRDPYTATLAELWDASIHTTIIGGKVVYQA